MQPCINISFHLSLYIYIYSSVDLAASCCLLNHYLSLLLPFTTTLLLPFTTLQLLFLFLTFRSFFPQYLPLYLYFLSFFTYEFLKLLLPHCLLERQASQFAGVRSRLCFFVRFGFAQSEAVAQLDGSLFNHFAELSVHDLIFAIDHFSFD